MVRISKFAAASALVVLACVACAQGGNPDLRPAGWPDDYKNFTIVWTGEKAVDLVTGPAPAVRAYIESFFLVRLTGDDKYLYPGFDGAVADEWRPGTGDPAGKPWVGTVTNHLLSLSRNDSDVSVIGCMYTYGAASPDGKGEYEAHGAPIGAPEGGISAFKVTLAGNSGTAGAIPPQTGPARTPVDDVFSGYRVTGYWGGYFEGDSMNNWNWPEREQATEECIAKAPDPFERRNYLLENSLPQSTFTRFR